MTIITNTEVKHREPVLKDLVSTLLWQGKPEQEVFQSLQYWNKQIPGTAEDIQLKTLVDSVKQERLERLNNVKMSKRPWEIEGDTLYRKLAKGFIEEQPFFYDRNRLWWMWNRSEHYWYMVDEVDLMVAVDKWTRIESEKPAFKHSLLEALKKQGRQNEPKQAPKTWIQFK
ncbi:MAG: hypothetical protein JRF37_03350, partial [Deltaproteobacteria bacterium]|nr:hypothetical protein [Deltaproteobacteria bacterium]